MADAILQVYDSNAKVYYPIRLKDNGDGTYALGQTVSVAADIEIGAVEPKDADSDARTNIKAANTARTTATIVLAVQGIDAGGNVLTLPAALAAGGGLKIEGVAGGVTVPVTADTELPAASAINGTILKSVSAPVVGAALLVSDNTNLIQPLGDAANGLDVDVTRSALPTGASTSALQGGGLPAALAASGGLKVEGVAGGVAQPVSLATAPALVAGTANIGKVDAPTATPTIYNVTCTVADTEYSQALDTNCRGFEFQARTEAVVRFAVVTGKVATPTAPYMTLKAGDYYVSPQLAQGASPSTLYVASPTAGTAVEIIAWV